MDDGAGELMFTAEIVLAAVILTSPPASDPVQGQLPSPYCVELLDAIRPSLLAIAIDAEAIDQREFDVGVDTLRSRIASLRTAPAIGECDRFPDRKLIVEFLALNRAYRVQLVARLDVDLFHADEIRGAIGETDQLYHAWDTLRDATAEHYYVAARRDSLRLLRDLIGCEAFYSGRMPPHVPVWHWPGRKS